MNKELYLTDEQCLKVLKKIEAVVVYDDFVPSCFDSTFPGDKYTESNCGFCNDAFTEVDMALFPEQYPERRSMKYRLEGHRCPFDERIEPGLLGWGSGCFGGCYLFKHRVKQDWNLLLMREMVNDVLEVSDNM